MKIGLSSIFLSLILLSISLTSEPALAACNATCQAKCRATATDVQGCIARWAEINKNPAEARRREEEYMRANGLKKDYWKQSK